MCPPWIEGAHAGAPLQEEAFLTSMSATWYYAPIMASETHPTEFSSRSQAPAWERIFFAEAPASAMWVMSPSTIETIDRPSWKTASIARKASAHGPAPFLSEKRRAAACGSRGFACYLLFTAHWSLFTLFPPDPPLKITSPPP